MDLEDEALLVEFGKRLTQSWEQAKGPQFIDPAFETPMALRVDRCLNYVWLNKESLKDRTEPPEELCGIQLSYLDKAYANARRYPDTRVMVWMDYDLFDASTKFFLDSHAYLNAPHNVKFMDLRSIESYADCPYYQPDSKAHIHNKVDLARIIVLEHVKRTMDYAQAFYADFDVEDVQLDRAETVGIMDKNGIVFGRLPKGERISHYFTNNLSPGYIAIDDKGAEYLTERLLPSLLEAAKGNRSIVLNIFRELGHEFGGKDSFISDTLDSLTTSIPMHPSGYQMPEVEQYKFNNLCAPAPLWS